MDATDPPAPVGLPQMPIPGAEDVAMAAGAVGGPPPAAAAAAAAADDDDDDDYGKDDDDGATIGMDADALVAAGVTWETYMTRKTAFEKMHFFFLPTASVGCLAADGTVMTYDVRSAYHALDAKYMFTVGDGGLASSGKHKGRQSFLDLWMNDASRKEVKDFGWHVDAANPLMLHTPLRLAFRDATPRDALPADIATRPGWEPYVHLFLRLVDKVSGGGWDTSADFVYLLQYCADILQHPTRLPGVCVLIRGDKGCGKDTLVAFLSRVVGTGHYCCFSKAKALFSEHQLLHVRKLVVHVPDIDRGVINANAAELRALITTPEVVINPKNKDPVHTPNVMRLFLTTNQADAVNARSEGMAERRFAAITCAPKKSPEEEGAFFTHVYLHLFSRAAVAAVGTWLSTLPLGQFAPRQLPPATLALSAVGGALDERSPTDEFIHDVWAGRVWRSTQYLYDEYVTWMRGRDVKPKSVFGKDLAQMVLGHHLEGKRGHSNKAFFVKPADKRRTEGDEFAQEVPGEDADADPDDAGGEHGGGAPEPVPQPPPATVASAALLAVLPAKAYVAPLGFAWDEDA